MAVRPLLNHEGRSLTAQAQSSVNHAVRISPTRARVEPAYRCRRPERTFSESTGTPQTTRGFLEPEVYVHRSAAPSGTPAIDCIAVARRFGSRWVLRGVTLRVAAGQIMGLLGANGSGKSTLLRVLSTLLQPNAGTVRIGGIDATEDPDGVRALIGFCAHVPGLYDDLSARENLVFAAAMHGLDARRIDPQLERVGLIDVASHRVRGFSAGMQRRLALARLLLSNPRVLLLDEPYANLDTAGIALVNEVLKEHVANGGAALVVLHELAPVAGLLDGTLTIKHGRIDSDLGTRREGGALARVT